VLIFILFFLITITILVIYERVYKKCKDKDCKCEDVDKKSAPKKTCAKKESKNTGAKKTTKTNKK
jgi:hypothetical protein